MPNGDNLQPSIGERTEGMGHWDKQDYLNSLVGTEIGEDFSRDPEEAMADAEMDEKIAQEAIDDPELAQIRAKADAGYRSWMEGKDSMLRPDQISYKARKQGQQAVDAEIQRRKDLSSTREQLGKL